MAITRVRHLIISVLLHACLLILIWLASSDEIVAASAGNRPIHATLVSSEQLKALKQSQTKKQVPIPEKKKSLKQNLKAKAKPKLKPEPKQLSKGKQRAVSKARVQTADNKIIRSKTIPAKTNKKPSPKVIVNDKALLQELAQERAQVRRELLAGASHYHGEVLAAISEHWHVPREVEQGEQCRLLVRVAPGGMVLKVIVTKSSGNIRLDRSARLAVLQASPLPVPDDPALFEAFRVFELTAKPEGFEG